MVDVRILFYFFLAIIAVYFFVRLTEARMVFFPMRPVTATPADAGLSGFEEVLFRAQDGVALKGWFIPAEGARLTILFLHGNAGNISHRLEKIKILHELGFSIFIFDYRGFGKSEGKPTEQGFYRDADAAFRYLRDERRMPSASIVLYGESLGGAVAIDLAAKQKAAALITEGTFTSVGDMARSAFPFVPRFFLSIRFDALSKIRQARVPKLIIHSIGDEIVPYTMAERLYAAAPQPKTMLSLKGGHNTAFVDSEWLYRDGLKKFIESVYFA